MEPHTHLNALKRHGYVPVINVIALIKVKVKEGSRNIRCIASEKHNKAGKK